MGLCLFPSTFPIILLLNISKRMSLRLVLWELSAYNDTVPTS